jgi:hypothetical protein
MKRRKIVGLYGLHWPLNRANRRKLYERASLSGHEACNREFADS